jgi:hypothetical protein
MVLATPTQLPASGEPAAVQKVPTVASGDAVHWNTAQGQRGKLKRLREQVTDDDLAEEKCLIQDVQDAT